MVTYYLFLINLILYYWYSMLYKLISFKFVKNIIMNNLLQSNSCVNCVNHSVNKCSLHDVTVTPSNTCETFTQA